MKVTAELHAFLMAEIRNEADGGDSPTTLGTAWDSMQQMDDDTICEYAANEYESDPDLANALRLELEALVAKYGYAHQIDDTCKCGHSWYI